MGNIAGSEIDFLKSFCFLKLQNSGSNGSNRKQTAHYQTRRSILDAC